MREDRSNEVLILNKGSDISYAGCGLPYYVGHVIEDRAQLIVNTPAKFEALTGAQVCTGTEATHVDREQKTVTAVDLATGTETVYPYDKLVIATGASPVQPPIAGVELGNVFFMRTPQGRRGPACPGGQRQREKGRGGRRGLYRPGNRRESGRPGRQALCAGYGPPRAAGLRPRVRPPTSRASSPRPGIPVVTGVKVTGLEGEDGKVKKVLTDKKGYKCDLVVLSAGIRPNTAFLNDTGLEMFKGHPPHRRAGPDQRSRHLRRGRLRHGPQRRHRQGRLVSHGAPRPTSRPHGGREYRRQDPELPRLPGHRRLPAAPDSTWAAPVSPRTRLRPRALTPSASSPSWTTRPTICPAPAASSSS